MNNKQLAKIIVERMRKKVGASSQQDLAKILNIKPPSISGAIQKGKIPDRWFEVMEEKFGVTREELTAPPKRVRAALVQPYGSATTEEEADYDPHFTRVRKAQVKLSAGGGNFVFDEGWTGLYRFRTDWLNYICTVNHAVLFDVSGESMEPTIHDRDTVLIDTARTSLENEKIYAIGVGETVLIKRLRMTARGNVIVVSDNPDKSRFPDEEISPDELRILGMVVWRGGVV